MQGYMEDIVSDASNMKYPKKIREKNPALLNEYRDKPCAVFDYFCHGMVAAHHIKTKGSGGDDTPENLVALCFYHHRKIHDIGPEKFLEIYPKLKSTIAKKE